MYFYNKKWLQKFMVIVFLFFVVTGARQTSAFLSEEVNFQNGNWKETKRLPLTARVTNDNYSGLCVWGSAILYHHIKKNKISGVEIFIQDGSSMPVYRAMGTRDEAPSWHALRINPTTWIQGKAGADLELFIDFTMPLETNSELRIISAHSAKIVRRIFSSQCQILSITQKESF